MSEVVSFDKKQREKQVYNLMAEVSSMLEGSPNKTKKARSETSAAYYDKKLKRVNDELESKGLTPLQGK